MRAFLGLILTIFAFHPGFAQTILKDSIRRDSVSNRGIEVVPKSIKFRDPIDPGFIEPDELSISYNSNPGTLTYYEATGGSGSFNYQWQKSVDDENWSNINGATQLTYNPGNLTSTSYFRVHVMQTDQNDEAYSSNCIVFVGQPIEIGKILPIQKTIVYNTNPGAITFGGVTGGTDGFSYQWQSSTDNEIWKNISGANGLSYTPGIMKGTIYYRVAAHDAASTVYSDIAKIIVKIKPGVISPSSQAINNNAIAAPLTCTPANDGNTLFTYQWQSSIDNKNWNNIIGSTGLKYSPGSLFNTNYFRIQISDIAQKTYSNVATVQVKNGDFNAPVMVKESDMSSPIDLSKPVGSIKGKFGTDGSGGINYTIPINVMPGTNGMQPSINLLYSSKRGRGISGYGWDLSAFSAISRSGKINYYDNITSPITYTNTKDAFVLDGHRLFPLSGANGANGTIYGKENEDFSKIQSFAGTETSGPDYFVVTKKDGSVLEYGRNTKAKFLTDDGKSTVIWLLNKITDKNNNYCSFVYNIDQANRNYTIAEIDYAGNTTTGLQPYNKIIFNYALVPNWQYLKKYISGASVRSPYLLNKIEVMNRVGVTVRSYQCAYSTLNGEYFLRQFSETGAGANMLNPLKFTYGIATSTQKGVIVSNQFEGISNGDINDKSSTKSYAGNFIGNGKAGYLSAYYTNENGVIRFSGYSLHGGFDNPYTTPDEVSSIRKLFSNNNHDIVGFSSTSIKSTNDYDGDGKTDVLFTSYSVENNNGVPLQLLKNIQINYTRNWQTGLGYDSSVLSTMPTSVQGGYLYNNIGPNHFYLIPGDFDGDGAQDYILVLGKTNGLSNDYKLFFNSPKKGIVNKEVIEKGSQTPTSIATLLTLLNPDHIQAIDFDGDGKHEILAENRVISIFNDKSSPGYEYADSILYIDNSGHIGNSSYILSGDFNGDGMSDLLVRYSTNVNGNWYLHYSTGKEFKSYLFQFSNPPNVDNYGDDESTDILMVSDLNRDGKSDIWVSQDFLKNGSTLSKHFVYFSLGEPTDSSDGISAFIAHGDTLATSIAFDNKQPRVYGDFDGDGKIDVLITQKNPSSGLVYPSRIIFPRPSREDFLMVKTTSSVGLETGISYDRLNTRNKYSKSNEYDSRNPGGGPDQAAYSIITSPMFVVSSVSVPNGIGGTKIVNYQYLDAAASPLRGFIGFKKITSNNTSDGHSSETINDINQQFLIAHPVTQSTYLTNVEPIAKTIVTDTFVRISPSNALDKRFVHHTLKTVNTDEITGVSTESSNIYDNYNNITSNTTKKGYLTNGAITAVETTKTDIVYGIHATPIPALPETVTITNTRTGQSAVSKKRTYAYDSKGNIQKGIDWSGTSLATTTTNTYDSFGNIKTIAISAPNVTTPTVTLTYDNIGLSLIEKLTAGNGIIKTETYTYEPKWGLPATSVTSDGLTTKYTYDADFGRLIKTTLPNANIISQTFAWEKTGNLRYSLTTQRVSDGGNYTKEYYDALNRKIKVETSGFNNQNLTSSTDYNLKGEIASTTAPYYPNETAVTTTNTYDNFGRLTRSSNGTTFKTTAYSKLSGGQYLTTTTNAAGQASSKTQDASGQIITVKDNGGQLKFTYDSWGNQKAVSLGSNTVVSSVYDTYGRQTSVTEKNAGTLTYGYNAFGQITKQTDALGHTYTISYDAFGRISKRTGPEGNTNYTYYNDVASGNCNDNVTKITGFAGDVTTFVYDDLQRPLSESVVFNGATFTKLMAYDNYSNLIKTTYPSGVIINDTYDKNAHLIKTAMTNGNTVKILFTATTMNSRGIYTGYSYGNGKTSTVTYDLKKGVPSRYYTAGIQDLNLTFDSQTGNLTSRNDGIKNLTETFTFDNLDRLTGSKVNNVQQFTMTYDNTAGTSLGNIATKSDIGKYVYDANKINAIKYITSTAGGKTPPGVISQAQQAISYTPFLKVDTISQNGYNLSYTYSHDYQRIKSILKQGASINETKYYLGDFERQVKGTITKDIHYIEAGNGLCAIVVKQGSQITPYFVYTDHLGSILSVTDSAGTPMAQQNFDAWGRSRNPTTWTYTNVPAVPDWLYRGYTSHEHMTQFALINMNGRIYDPAIGSMLSPDNYVPTPWSTQGYNRYSYANNNPLKYVDPTGWLFNSWDEVWGAVDQLWDQEYGGRAFGPNDITPFTSDVDGFEYAAGIMYSDDSWGSNGFASSFSEAQNAYYSYGGHELGVASLNQPIVVLGKIVDDQWQTSNIIYPKDYTEDKNGIITITLPGEKDNVGAPGFWESIIPVWGSTRAAINDFQTGHWGWGLFNSALAVTDLFLVKSIVTGIGKASVGAAAKGGVQYTKSSLALGREVHAGYKVAEHAPALGRFKEFTGIKGIRPDFVDFGTKTIYELKPFNPRGIQLGTKQLNNYKSLFEQNYGGTWKTVLDHY